MEYWSIPLTLRELTGYFRDLDENARPTMREQKRNGIGGLALHMHKVDGELLETVTLDRCGELRELVETCFSFLPIETRSPVVAYPLHIARRRPSIPSNVVEFIWVGSPVEALLEVDDASLRKGNSERLNITHGAEDVWPVEIVLPWVFHLLSPHIKCGLACVCIVDAAERPGYSR